MTKNPILCGVLHDMPLFEEYKELIDDLHRNGIKKIGMELATDWESRNYARDFGMKFDPRENFFSRLAKYAQSKNIEIIGIDSRVVYEINMKLHRALDFRVMYEKGLKGRKPTEESFKQFSKYIRKIHDPKDRNLRVLREKALEIARLSTLEQIEKKYLVIVRKRSKSMVKKIQKNTMDAIIVGAGHAPHISEALALPILDYKQLVSKSSVSVAKLDEREREILKNYQKEKDARNAQRQLENEQRQSDAPERIRNNLPEGPPAEPTPIINKPKKKKNSRRRRR